MCCIALFTYNYPVVYNAFVNLYKEAMSLQDFKSQIDKSSNILIVLPFLVDPDSIASSALLYKMFAAKGKNVTIAAEKNPITRFTDIFSIAGFDASQILHEIQPISYVITVPELSQNVDITWDKKDDQVNLRLIPESGIVDFDKIKYSKEGGIYDLVITVNVSRLLDLGKIYSFKPKKFEEFNIASLGPQLVINDVNIVSFYDDNFSTTTELIFQNAKELGLEIDSAVAEITAKGIVGSTFGLQRVEKNRTFGVIAEIANKYQIDISAIIKKYFYSMSKADVKIEERILKNLRFDDSRKTVYSLLTNNDFLQLGLSENDLDVNIHLPLRVNWEYEYSFIAIESGISSKIYISSTRNSTEFNEIINRANGFKNKNKGFVSINTNAIDASNQILSVISGNVLDQSSSFSQAGETLVAPKEVKSEDQNNLNPALNSLNEFVYTVENNLGSKKEQNLPLQSPFVKAADISNVIDNSASPLKKADSFSEQNKPFDPAVN